MTQLSPCVRTAWRAASSSRLRAANEDALPGCQAVRLDHARWPGDGHRLGRRHTRVAHDLLRKRLGALDSRRGRARAEDGDARHPQLVGDTCDERGLGADDYEVGRQVPRQLDHRLAVLGVNRVAGAELGDARVSRGRVKLFELRALRELPRQCVLASSRSD